MTPINNLNSTPLLTVQNRPAAAADALQMRNDVSFADWLNRSLETVNSMQQEADAAARNLISGENKDIHGTMIRMQKAGIAMDLMLEVRNKIIAAYDEIKRMQF